MPESDEAAPIHVGAVSSDDPKVADILEALTVELAGAGYTASETFGYSVEQLQEHAVHLVGARVGGKLVGVGGLELQEEATGELKRFFVPLQRS